MRNRQTWLIALTAFGLAVLPLVWTSSTAPPREDRISVYQITLLKDGKPVRAVLNDQPPRNLAEQFPELATGSAFSLTVEPATTAAELGAFGNNLSGADRSMIEFLLLLPPATLLVCFFRNIVGLNSFGTFAPALLGLAFRDVESLVGVFVVLSIISAGWWLRRGLDGLHLLQAPRAAVMLSCIVVMLLVIIVALSGPGPRAIAFFPLVILTGMVERFWSLEEEEGPGSSLGVLTSTLFMAACVWAVATNSGASRVLLQRPQWLGPVVAGQLLLGRYTGFRLLELYRFRAMANQTPPTGGPVAWTTTSSLSACPKRGRKRKAPTFNSQSMETAR